MPLHFTVVPAVPVAAGEGVELDPDVAIVVAIGFIVAAESYFHCFV